MAARKNPTAAQKRIPQAMSLPPELHQRLNDEASARLVNPSLIVERALVAYLDQLAPVRLLDEKPDAS